MRIGAILLARVRARAHELSVRRMLPGVDRPGCFCLHVPYVLLSDKNEEPLTYTHLMPASFAGSNLWHAYGLHSKLCLLALACRV